MSTRTMGEWLRAAILAGGVCLLPAAALAEEGAAPDHAQAEARTGAELRAPTTDRIEGALDHGEAEARGPSSEAAPAPEHERATDHATVESRGAAAPR